MTAWRTPNMRRMASATKFEPVALETKGKLREALRLHSITLTLLRLARNCMLKGPVIASSRARSAAIFLIRRMVSM